MGIFPSDLKLFSPNELYFPNKTEKKSRRLSENMFHTPFSGENKIVFHSVNITHSKDAVWPLGSPVSVSRRDAALHLGNRQLPDPHRTLVGLAK